MMSNHLHQNNFRDPNCASIDGTAGDQFNPQAVATWRLAPTTLRYKKWRGRRSCLAEWLVHPMRVLIVEDEALLAFDLKYDIERRDGVSAVCVSNVRDAWLQIESQFDLVFLDINLRGETTYDLARELRKRRIPFVFTSGSLLPSLPEELQTEQYMSKPYDYKRLSDVIDRVIANKTFVASTVGK